MYQEFLEKLDLSPNEAKIYENLLGNSESSISQITVLAKVHRRNTYDAIRRLISKGLVFEIFSRAGNYYSAVDPDKLSELLSEKEQELQQILPDLKKKYNKTLSSEAVYIYRGREGQKNIWRDVLRVGQDNYMIGAKGGWFDPKLKIARTAFIKEANRKKIKFYILFDHTLKIQTPQFTKTWPGKCDYKYLPEIYNTDSIIHVFGDYVITYSGLELFKIKENTVFFVLHNKNLAISYRKWFQYMWDQSKDKKMISKVD